MKITICNYSVQWKDQFEELKINLQKILKDNAVIIEHIGSTAVKNLSAKPIIDIMVGVTSTNELNNLIKPLTNNGYIYYESYNTIMPKRRFFIKLKDDNNLNKFKSTYTSSDKLPHEAINELRLAQIHVWEYNSKDWIRHIAVRDYLRKNETLRLEYKELKQKISRSTWENGIAYNNEKNNFLKSLEKEAINYYK